MAKKVDVSGYERFSDVTSRLDEIVAAVRKKDTSLERSLDLFDEAIALGTRAVDLVDKAAFSPEERERMAHVDPHGEVEGEPGAGQSGQAPEGQLAEGQAAEGDGASNAVDGTTDATGTAEPAGADAPQA